MMEPSAADSAIPRAFLHVGGLTLARQQLGLALALGCERIACVARGLTPEMLALQHAAEKAGAQFHVITGPRALSGLVTATDEVLALAEGYALVSCTGLLMLPLHRIPARLRPFCADVDRVLCRALRPLASYQLLCLRRA